MLTLPPGISPDLVRDLEAIQKQIVVLIGNHQILSARLQENPKDALVQQQILAVENYLLEFNSKQMPIISKIREEIKSLQTSSDVVIKTEVPDEGDDEDDDGDEEMDDPSKEVTEKDNSSTDEKKENILKEDKCAITESSTAAAKKKTTNMSMGDRMAMVRGRKRKRKRRSGPGTPRRTPTPPKVDQEVETTTAEVKKEEDVGGDGVEEGKAEGEEEDVSCRYKAYVVQVEKKSFDTSLVEQLKGYDPEHPIQPREDVFHESDKRNFMMHLGLLSEDDIATWTDFASTVKERKREYRNLTYIPEQIEPKKQRASCWLSADLSSPPLLRTRRRNQLALQKPRRTRKVSNSASNSRASSPLDEFEEYEDADDFEEDAEAASTAAADRGSRVQQQEVDEDMADEGDDDDDDDNDAEDGMLAANSGERPRRDKAMTEKQRAKILKNKTNAERQIQKLEAKKEELEAALKGNGRSKFTVATRKERTRQNDLIQEKAEVEAKLAKFTSILSHYNKLL